MMFLTYFHNNQEARDVAIKITQALALVATSCLMRTSKNWYMQEFSNHLSEAAIAYSGIASHLSSTVLSCRPFSLIFNKTSIIGVSSISDRLRDKATAALNLSFVIRNVVDSFIFYDKPLTNLKKTILDGAVVAAVIQFLSSASSCPRDGVSRGICLLWDIVKYNGITLQSQSSSDLARANNSENGTFLNHEVISHILLNHATRWLLKPMVIATCCARVQITNQPILNGFVQIFASAAASYVFGMLYKEGEKALFQDDLSNRSGVSI
jgi:hypothetical protein